MPLPARKDAVRKSKNDFFKIIDLWEPNTADNVIIIGGDHI